MGGKSRIQKTKILLRQKSRQVISDRPLLQEILEDVFGGQVMVNGRSKLYKQGIKKVVSIWFTLNKRKRVIVMFGVRVVAIKR